MKLKKIRVEIDILMRNKGFEMSYFTLDFAYLKIFMSEF